MIISIKVIPNSSQSKIVLDKSGNIKVYLISQPERNKANLELIELLSNKLNISKKNIEIVSGITSKNKKIKIDNLTNTDILRILGLDFQTKI